MLKAFCNLAERTFPGARDRIGFDRSDEITMMALYKQHKAGQVFTPELFAVARRATLKYGRQLCVLANEKILAREKNPEPEAIKSEARQLEFDLAN